MMEVPIRDESVEFRYGFSALSAMGYLKNSVKSSESRLSIVNES